LIYPLVGTNRQTGLFFFEPGDKKSGRIAIMDKVLSLLISAGIVTFGAWGCCHHNRQRVALGLDADGPVSTPNRFHQPLWFLCRSWDV